VSGSLSLPPNIQATKKIASKTFKGSQGSGAMTLKLTSISGDINLKFSGPPKNVIAKADEDANKPKPPTKPTHKTKPKKDTSTKHESSSSASAGGTGSSGFASSSGGNSQACVGDKCIMCVNNKCTFEGKSIPPNSSISCKNGQCTVLGPGEDTPDPVMKPPSTPDPVMEPPSRSDAPDVRSSGSSSDGVSTSCAGDMCITCSNGGCTITKDGKVISKNGKSQ
jgi:hypothetical protein